ncbi:cilia- and flagella-associated protein 157 [Battus philenor]|uniref:cilia- and flagella-associated protein 157 n=1 Tax=Battus philenor TaxID=42288 RepID=UPI0035CF4FBB
MPPKKDAKKKNEPADEDAVKRPTVSEVERTFLQLEVADCNRKLARYRTAIEQYEVRNEELQKAYEKLDEDRADVIAYLKKVLNTKNEENGELKERVKSLEELREVETAQFKHTVAELERNFNVMKDQLTSENKLLSGKLNTLEEFRALKTDLMRKFEKQEQDFKDQEMKYKRLIYDTEKKFVIGKDKLKKEMEGRLLQLAQDFQDVTELRIAASTHRVIRENIAINNELDSILTSQSKLADQNENYKESERTARVAMQLAEEERDKAINTSIVQRKVIDQLTLAFQKINKEKALSEKKIYDFDTLQAKIQKLTNENDNLALKVRILEQNLHAKLSNQNKYFVESSRIMKENAKLKKILKEAATAIQAALKLDEWADTDAAREALDRQVLLSRLLAIVTQYRDIQKAESLETIGSLGKIYDEGDLGFIPKSSKKSVGSTTFMASSVDLIDGERESIPSVVLTPSSLGSIKTIPSMQVLPPSTVPMLPKKESIASFVTSSQSTVGSEATVKEEEEETEDIEKQLVRSKLEIQKSIMKDLAYSQMALSSQAKFIEERQKSLQSKSVIFEAQEDKSAVGEEMTRESGVEISAGEEVTEAGGEQDREAEQAAEAEEQAGEAVEDADDDKEKDETDAQ